MSRCDKVSFGALTLIMVVNINNDFWNTKWNLLWALVFFGMVPYFYKHYDWSLTSLCGLALLSSLWVVSVPGAPFFAVQEKIFAFMSSVTILFMILFYELFWNKYKKGFKYFFVFFPMVNSVFTIANYFFPFPGYSMATGFLGNASINASLTALCLPLTWEYFKKNRMVLFIVSIMVFVSIIMKINAIGLATFALVSCVYWVRNKIALGSVLLAIMIVCCALFCFQGFKWMDDNGRFQYYRLYLKKYLQPGTHLIWGIGNGCFPHYSIELISENDLELRGETENGENCVAGCWVHAHNDWLEILVGLGFLGFLLAIVVYFKTLVYYGKMGSVSSFTALLGFGFCSFFNSMLKYVIPFLFVFSLVLEALRKGGEND